MSTFKADSLGTYIIVQLSDVILGSNYGLVDDTFNYKHIFKDFLVYFWQ